MEKYIHPNLVTNLVGNSHRYVTSKGEISLLYPSRYTMNMFEIYCIQGELFEDTERFDTLEEAEQAIKKYLS